MEVKNGIIIDGVLHEAANYPNDYECTICSGTGYIKVRKRIKVPIPAGIDNGQSVRIREKGEPGINGGPRGDLLVNVTVSRHPKFQRQEYDIYSTEPVTFAQAALGGNERTNWRRNNIILV